MNAFFISVVIVLLAVLLITVIKKLSKSTSQHMTGMGFVVIPVWNGMEKLTFEVKSACWDETFKGPRARKILLVPTERPDSYTDRELLKLKNSFPQISVVEASELNGYILDDTRVYKGFLND